MQPDLIHLASGAARATIAVRGAEPVAWAVAGVPLLWAADPAWWAGTSPILFPVVGWSRGGVVRTGGKAYSMPVHGFAGTCDFQVLDRSPDRVRLSLGDGAATRVHYPYAFRLTVEWHLRPDGLAAVITVDNPGRVELPYAVGVHPGFAWPLAGAARDRHRIRFERLERADVPVIAPGGLFSPRTRAVPLRDGRELALDDALFASDALCFLDAASRRVRFENGAGAAITVAAEGFPHIALWSRPRAPFLSIESWTGHGDPVDFAGELAERPSMRLLAPGQAVHHRVAWSWNDGSLP